MREHSWNGPEGKVYIARQRIDRGGYTREGQYFGVGAPLYLATDEVEFVHYFRAADRSAAVAYMRDKFPGLKLARG